MSPLVRKILDACRSLTQATGHELVLVPTVADMPVAPRVFEDVHHDGTKVYAVVRNDLRFNLQAAVHETAHAITARDDAHRFGKDWQPRGGEADLVESDEIEQRACEAQYVLMALLDVPVWAIRITQDDMSAPLSAPAEVIDRVCEVWQAAGLLLNNGMRARVCVRQEGEAWD